MWGPASRLGPAVASKPRWRFRAVDGRCTTQSTRTALHRFPRLGKPHVDPAPGTWERRLGGGRTRRDP